MKMGTAEPLRIHKRLLIYALLAHPEDLSMMFPDGPYKTAQEAIDTLQAHPATYVVDGHLNTDDPRCMER